MGSTPVARTDANNTVLEMLVDSGSTEHYLDSDLMPGLQKWVVDYKEPDETTRSLPLDIIPWKASARAPPTVVSPTRTATSITWNSRAQTCRGLGSTCYLCLRRQAWASSLSWIRPSRGWIGTGTIPLQQLGDAINSTYSRYGCTTKTNTDPCGPRPLTLWHRRIAAWDTSIRGVWIF